MRPRIVILKTGSTFVDLAATRGDYEDWLAEGLGYARRELSVVNAEAGDDLPEASTVDAMVVTGSSAMVTDRAPWSARAGALLGEVVHRGRPVLAICYGHQLLADALGGVVADNPRGRQVGTATVTLTPAGRTDALLGPGGAETRFQVSHRQVVSSLPPGAVRLATTAHDANHAFRVGPRAWAVQFHPEFDREISRTHIERRRALLAAEGRDADAALRGLSETPDGPLLLARFAAEVER